MVSKIAWLEQAKYDVFIPSKSKELTQNKCSKAWLKKVSSSFNLTQNSVCTMKMYFNSCTSTPPQHTH